VKQRWEMVALGDVLTERGERVGTADADALPLLGVSNTDGLHRSGKTRISDMSRYLLVKRDWFAYNPMRINVGSLGWADSDDLTGVISPDYVVFSATDKILPRLVYLFLKSKPGLHAINLQAAGSVRQRLYFWMLAEITIPLPPLPEQRRIVAKIEELAAKIKEANRLKAVTLYDSLHFWKVLSRIARANAFPTSRLGDMVDFLDGQRVPLRKSEREKRHGQYPYYGASGIIDYLDDYLFDEDLLLLSEDGANLINRSTPIAFVARGQYWVNNHAHVLRPRSDAVDIRFLEYALSDYDVSEFNFASAQAKLNQKNAMRISFALPPLPEQRRIVAHLDDLQAKVDSLKALQAQSAAELDALLPSILDKAFKGELA
jgi:type I restriction enzyme, S subunit